jgi:hypothetical protein
MLTYPLYLNNSHVVRTEPLHKTNNPVQFLNNKSPTEHSAVKLRCQVLNNSAMRSHGRLNSIHEGLWRVIPKHERALHPGVADLDVHSFHDSVSWKGIVKESIAGQNVI